MHSFYVLINAAIRVILHTKMLKKQNTLFIVDSNAVISTLEHLVIKHVLRRMEEQQLAEQCRLGKNKARKELYELYANRLYAICLRYSNNRDTAQDLLHDGFIKILHSFDKFTWRGEGSLRAWMERIMVNEALQYLRKTDIINNAANLDDSPELYAEPSTSDIDIIPETVLMQFINELPAGYRTVFNLYTFEDKSHKEIAELLEINEKSSASQLFRAKNTLAKKVKEWINANYK